MSASNAATNTRAVLSAALIAAGMGALGMYSEALAWASQRGTLIDMTLSPLADPMPAPAWVFPSVFGVLTAVCLVWLLSGPASAGHRTMLRAAAVVSIMIMIAAMVVWTATAGVAIHELAGWQRAGHFITRSSSFAVFACLMVAPVVLRLRLAPAGRLLRTQRPSRVALEVSE
ncbi:hypothetical protein [Microbacterium phyllosphaerae]|uniref:hypothetical protein n=1 Tax=Microbacterium phyllosphaerae TaxID=124798 RepID=UPI0021694BAF|nr:hypothetical protein [Microbacterium phyllosphaerae]MCS3442173.1 hypothetical protein [Microbacterium phyllosphaerae]